MKSIRIELIEVPDFPEGYAVVPWKFPSEEEQLQKLIEELPKNVKYITHFVHHDFEPNGNFYTPEKTSLKIRTGTAKYYMNVFVEDK